MANLSAIRNGLKTTIEAAHTGLHVYARHPDQVRLPALIIMPQTWYYRQAMGDVNRALFELILLAEEQAPGFERAQMTVDEYLDDTGAKSIKAAIERDKRLGGAATTCHVPNWRDYGNVYMVNGVGYASVTIDVEVWP